MYYLFMGVCYVVSVDSGNGCFDRYVIVVVVKINIRIQEGSLQEFVVRILRMFIFNGLWIFRKLKRKEVLYLIYYINFFLMKKNLDC